MAGGGGDGDSGGGGGGGCRGEDPALLERADSVVVRGGSAGPLLVRRALSGELEA